MPVTVQMESDKLAVVRITGLLKKSEMDSLLAPVSKELDATPKARFNVLMIVEGFTGWEGDANWGDMSFYAAHGDKMLKIAIVGDPKREQDWLMFMGGGIRPTPVKFFPTGQVDQARKWLG
jgi:hypothetical protein